MDCLVFAVAGLAMVFFGNADTPLPMASRSGAASYRCIAFASGTGVGAALGAALGTRCGLGFEAGVGDLSVTASFAGWVSIVLVSIVLGAIILDGIVA